MVYEYTWYGYDIYVTYAYIYIYKYIDIISMSHVDIHMCIYIYTVYIRTYMNYSAYMYPRTDMYMHTCLCPHIVMHQPDVRRGVCGDGHGSSEATFGTRSTTARCADGVALCGSQGKGWMGWIVAVVESLCLCLVLARSDDSFFTKNVHRWFAWFFFFAMAVVTCTFANCRVLQFSPTGRRQRCQADDHAIGHHWWLVYPWSKTDGNQLNSKKCHNHMLQFMGQTWIGMDRSDVVGVL